MVSNLVKTAVAVSDRFLITAGEDGIAVVASIAEVARVFFQRCLCQFDCLLYLFNAAQRV